MFVSPLLPKIIVLSLLSSVPFKGPTNEAVVSTLSKEVMANNPQFQAHDIQGLHTNNLILVFSAAAYTYYRTKNQEQSLKQRGMFVERNRSRRRHERLLRVRIFIDSVKYSYFLCIVLLTLSASIQSLSRIM